VAREFGLGQLFDIGIPGQKQGLIPDTAYKRRNFPKDPVWHPGETPSVGIGQGYVSVNPLQLCVQAARLANGQKALLPRLIHSIGGIVQPSGAAAARGERLSLRALARNRTFVVATIYAWIFMGALGCSVTYLAVALHEGLGLSAVAAGGYLAVLQLGGLTGRIGWGVLSDRIGSRGGAMVTCACLSVAGCLAMALLRGPAAPLLLALVSFGLGLSTMGWNALYITLSADAVPISGAATAVGAGTTVTFTGMFLVTPLFGLIADHTGSYTVSWLALAAWCGAGVLVGLGIRDRSQAAPATVSAA